MLESGSGAKFCGLMPGLSLAVEFWGMVIDFGSGAKFWAWC